MDLREVCNEISALKRAISFTHQLGLDNTPGGQLKMNRYRKDLDDRVGKVVETDMEMCLPKNKFSRN